MDWTMAKQSKYKLRISGDVVEFWEYESPIFLEGNNSGGRRKKGEQESEKADEYRKQNNRKSKDAFRSLVSTNFKDGDKFITLTFRDTDSFDIKNVEHTNKEFKKFMQRLRYKYGDFKYIAVIEFQDENKRGAVHYHLMASLPYVPYETLAGIWGHGYIGINYIKGVDNIGAYISKYMSKDLGDKRLNGKKNYLPSRNLEKPIVVYGKTAKDTLESVIGTKKGQKKEVFTDCYESEHFGNINYKEYNLKRNVKQTKKGFNQQEKEKMLNEIKNVRSLLGVEDKTMIEETNKLIRSVEDGTFTYSGAILADVQRRAKNDVRGDWDRVSFLSQFLARYGTDRDRKIAEQNQR